jgi:hypothetical protein
MNSKETYWSAGILWTLEVFLGKIMERPSNVAMVNYRRLYDQVCFLKSKYVIKHPH